MGIDGVPCAIAGAEGSLGAGWVLQPPGWVRRCGVSFGGKTKPKGLVEKPFSLSCTRLGAGSVLGSPASAPTAFPPHPIPRRAGQRTGGEGRTEGLYIIYYKIYGCVYTRVASGVPWGTQSWGAKRRAWTSPSPPPPSPGWAGGPIPSLCRSRVGPVAPPAPHRSTVAARRLLFALGRLQAAGGSAARGGPDQPHSRGTWQPRPQRTRLRCAGAPLARGQAACRTRGGGGSCGCPPARGPLGGQQPRAPAPPGGCCNGTAPSAGPKHPLLLAGQCFPFKTRFGRTEAFFPPAAGCYRWRDQRGRGTRGDAGGGLCQNHPWALRQPKPGPAAPPAGEMPRTRRMLRRGERSVPARPRNAEMRTPSPALPTPGGALSATSPQPRRGGHIGGRCRCGMGTKCRRVGLLSAVCSARSGAAAAAGLKESAPAAISDERG